MKKRTVFLLLVMCLCLGGCITDLPNPSGIELEAVQRFSEQDAQNQYLFVGTMSFQETDGFYCGSSFLGDYQNYYDKTSGISGVLCADPACTHDSSVCGAYMEEGGTLSVYDGKLYWIAPESGGRDMYLWQSDLSGMNRKKLKLLSFDDVIIKYQPLWYVVHRGMLYIQGSANSVDGTQSICRDMLVSSSLDDSEEFTVLYEKVSDLGMNTTVRYVGNCAYISAVTFPLEGSCDITVTKMDLTTGASEIIYAETEIAASLDALWATPQGELYLPGADEHHAYVWRIEDGKRVEIVSWWGADPSMPYVLDGVAVYLSRPDDLRLVEIIDLNGKAVYSGPLFPEGVPGLEGDPNTYSFAVIGGDTEKIVLNLQNHTGSSLQNYTILLDLQDGLKPTILWSGSI